MYSLEQYLYGRGLPPELLAALQALSNRYGDDLLFLSRNTEEINFAVRGRVDQDLFKDLQDNQDEIFGADFRNYPSFHIVSPMGRSSDRGVFLIYKSAQTMKNEYKGGFWYY